VEGGGRRRKEEEGGGSRRTEEEGGGRRRPKCTGTREIVEVKQKKRDIEKG
jgi:hypothetical protein